MLWCKIHNILNTFSSMKNETRNNLTFLIGTLLYALIYFYAGSLDFMDNLFIKSFFGFFIFVLIIVDGFAMAKQSFNEVNEMFSPNKYFEPDENYIKPKSDKLLNNSNYIDKNEDSQKLA